MIEPPYSTKFPKPRDIADPPLVSDGIKSIYVNWQGPPVSDDRSCSSSGPVVRSILTGCHESISAIARAEIDNPDSDYAVQFSPMPKGQARLEVARIARPAAALPIPRRSRQLRVRPPDGLRTQTEAARKLGCSIKTLNGYVKAGALKYVALGHGKRRQRRRFTDADLNEFIANQTRKDSPCPSDATRARRSGNTDSKSEVVSFSALQRRRTGAKPNR